MRALQPRAGFAYQITNNLVMRGGWGRYYINPNNNFIQTNGFTVNTPLVNSLDSGRTPIPNALNNPFPEGIRVPSGASLGPLTFLGRGFSFADPDSKLPYVNQFSFGFQYGLPGQSKVEVSYSGSRGRDLQDSLSENILPLELRKQCNLAEGGNPLYCDEQLPNPFLELAPSGKPRCTQAHESHAARCRTRNSAR
jgi:hypothetical protein